jgi:uncharacterized repeat protein (TIGR01451 family)
MKKILFFLFTLFTVNSYADCPGMTVTLHMYDPNCFNSCNGYGYVSVAGGSGNYNYFYQDVASGNPAGNQVNDSIYGLCSGNYRVIVHDITNACFDTTLFTLVNPIPITGTVITDLNVTCAGGSDGMLTAFATGGTGPYTYVWSNGSTLQTATNLPAGVYTVQIYDANGCMTLVTGVVTEPTPLTAFATFNPATCGQCDGIGVGNATGGTAPYVYLWQPNMATTQTVTNLCPGSYQLLVTDANGCVTGTGGNVGTTSSIVVTATSTPSGCNPCNGTVTVLESGGTSPYVYDLNGLNQQTNGNFSAVCPGTYVAMVTDSQGCVGTYSVNVASNTISGLTVIDSVMNESGFGANDGMIDLNVSGPSAPFTFLWSNGATTEDIYSLAGGNYSVTITDNNGACFTLNYFINTAPSYGYITGNIYFDNNQNCVFDGTDYPLANYYVMATNGTSIYYGYTNSNGDYMIWAPVGTYVVTPYTSTNLTSGCTASYNANVTNGSTISGNNFSYYETPFYDVCVSVWSPGIVPGFNGTYYIYVTNVGNQTATGSVCITLPSPLTFVGSNPAASSVTGNVICIDYTNLIGGTTGFYSIDFYTPPTLPLGTPMIACINATITNGTDVNPACNSYCYTRLVTGSFDPNDKTVSPAGQNATGDVPVAAEEFTYLVRFQNTGTGPAVNITITDTLTSMLNPLSFEMLNASHPYTVEFINGNIIKWRFENIMLPDSGSNEPASHGHVQFRLNTMNTPMLGQVIENRANIYFDFNEPVITNTAINTFVAPNSIEELSNGIFSIYPNPAENVLYVQSENGNSTYTIYDVSGKVYSSTNSISSNSSLDISSLSSGIYFIQCISGEEVSTIKFIKR